MRVKEAMTTPVIVLAPHTSVQEILALWKKHHVSGFPVVEEGHPIGMVTESDLVVREAPLPAPVYVHIFDLMIQLQTRAKLQEEILKVAGAHAREIMSQPVVTVKADQTVEEAAQIMVQKHVDLLPVVDEDNLLVGILSRGDILKTMGTLEGA